MVCSNCDVIGGICDKNAECDCEEGYFGRVCDRRIEKLRKKSERISVNLNRFDLVALEAIADPRDGHQWVFGVRVNSRARVVMRVNEADSPNYTYLTAEDRQDQSLVVNFNRWNADGYQEVPVTTSKNWVGASLMNLSPGPVQVTFTMTSKLLLTRLGFHAPKSDVNYHLPPDLDRYLLCHKCLPLLRLL